MKMRILGQLNGIAHGLKNSEGYLEKLVDDDELKALKFDERKIRMQAQKALTNLLHDYHRFRVVTIDSFFQSIVRELAYELDLTANLRVDLKAKEALAEAIKTLIDELGNADQKRLMQLVFEFIKERIEESSSWQIVDNLNKFGMHIFNENYLKQNKTVRTEMGDAEKLAKFKADLRKHRSDTINNIVASVNQLEILLKTQGLDETTLKGKTRQGVAPLLKRLKAIDHKSKIDDVLGKAWKKCSVAAEEWTTEKSLQPWVAQNAIPFLNNVIPMLQDLTSCNVMLENINEMMLLNAINEKLRDLNQEANRFLLADTGHFLRNMIDESDIPFIYERTGTRFHHIMIDEFQDTSELQWGNFKPLLHNSLSQLHRCLIVGDVKQSIYRWRNSDWSIFNGIEEGEFKPYINSVSLKRNFRSAQRVVEFNNAAFIGTVDVIQNYYQNLFGRPSDDISLAYQDVVQLVNEKKKNQGFVRIDNIEARENESKAECTLRHVEYTIKELLDAGIPESKIAILVRTKKQGNLIVQHLQATMPHVKVVSNEAYALEASHALQILIQALRVLNAPDEKLHLFLLILTYQRDILQTCQDEDWANTLFQQANTDSDLLLPADFAAEKRAELSKMPLYELCERLYQIFGLHNVSGQDNYLYSFYDQLLAYLHDHSSTLSMCLDYWDTELCTKEVQMGNTDGLQIMTIHKSKGLEFHTVIAPFFEWSADGINKKGKSYIWCEPQTAPFNEIPLIPIGYSKKLAISTFKDDYQEEMLRQLVDNMNLMYVTFTRAEQNLIVITRSDKLKDDPKKDFTPKLDQILQHALKRFATIPDAPTLQISELPEDKGPGLRYESGTLESKVVAEKATDDGNLLTALPQTCVQTFYHEPMSATFIQSNESQRFTMPLNEDEANTDAADYIMLGNIVHSILEDIETAEDLERALQRAQCNGIFKDENQYEEVNSLLRKALQTTPACQWFEAKWRVMNECRILYRDKDEKLKTCRPDRVICNGNRTIVIDYKTSHLPPSPALRKAYIRQVNTYKQHLQKMGYTNVEGYVWYVVLGEIDEV